MDDINMNRICFNCKKILKKSESSHIKKCVQHMNYVDGRYNQLIHDFKELDLSYNNIIDLYHNKEYSLISFKSEFGLAYKQTNFLLEYYNIENNGVYSYLKFQFFFMNYAFNLNDIRVLGVFSFGA